MENYTLGLALFDFIPVFLSGAGLYFIRNWVSARSDFGQIATVGGILIFSGGFFKALWKLIWVTTQIDINILEHSLFALIGSGFIILSFALFYTLKNKNPSSPWRMPLILVALYAAAAGSGYYGGVNPTIIGIAITTLANAYFSIRLSVYCFKQKAYLPGALVLGNFILILAASGIARTSGQTIDQQWLAEINNTLAQGVFALGTWMIYKKNI